MAVERGVEADWGHWPGRSARPRRRERLERTLFSATDAAPPPEPEAQAERAPRATHILFASSPQGYRLLKGHGDLPGLRDVVTIDGDEFVVAKLGRSPLPGDDRICAFLEPR